LASNNVNSFAEGPREPKGDDHEHDKSRDNVCWNELKEERDGKGMKKEKLGLSMVEKINNEG